jgi:hypothetical protein
MDMRFEEEIAMGTYKDVVTKRQPGEVTGPAFKFPRLRRGKRRMRWGVEIELECIDDYENPTDHCAIRRHRSLDEILESIGCGCDVCRRSAEHEFESQREDGGGFAAPPRELVNKGWKCKGDGSLDNGIEYVGPPFDSLQEGLDDTKKLLDKVGDHFAARRSCGLHVHVDAQAFKDEASMRNFALNVVQMEYLLYGVMARSRRNGNYCKNSLKLPPWYVEDHYRGFNGTSAVRSHNSFEFRYHGGTKSPRKVAAWARLIWSLYHLGAHRPKAMLDLTDDIVGCTDRKGPKSGLILLCDLLEPVRQDGAYWETRWERLTGSAVDWQHYAEWRTKTARAAGRDTVRGRIDAASRLYRKERGQRVRDHRWHR